MNKISLKKLTWKNFATFIATIVLAIAAGIGIDIAVRPAKDGDTVIEASFSMELAEEQIPALVEVSEGVVEEQTLPTVEIVDGGKIPEVAEDRDKGAEAARGFAIDISTPWTVRNILRGQCIVLTNPFGSQCYNTTAVIMENQVGYWPSTNSTGAARGIWEARYENAGDDCGEIIDGIQYCKNYALIYDITKVRDGDLFVTDGGTWGHTGEVAGFYSNGYFPSFSTNQGGDLCAEGGSAANTINLSGATFLGAFRWYGWDYLFEEPDEPEPPKETIPYSNCVLWHLERGDTMSKIMLECENTVAYGEAMDAYAKTWYSLIYEPGQSVYDGWYHSGNGVGLYEGDDIEHRVGD